MIRSAVFTYKEKGFSFGKNYIVICRREEIFGKNVLAKINKYFLVKFSSANAINNYSRLKMYAVCGGNLLP